MRKSNHFYIEEAFKVSNSSKDPSTKVGAIIIDRDGKIISRGYNSFPANIPDRDEWWSRRECCEAEFTKYDLAVCGEQNAILSAKQILEGFSLYCTHFPCLQCAKIIVNVGIRKVIYCLSKESISRSIDEIKVRRLFELAGVELVQVDIN